MILYLYCVVINLFLGYPSDQELQEVSKEVMGKLGDDWTKLQPYLNIPDYVIAEINSPRTTLNQKVFWTLHEWRKHSRDGSKEKLAQCLRAADQRLSKAANKLCSNECILISPTSIAQCLPEAAWLCLDLQLQVDYLKDHMHLILIPCHLPWKVPGRKLAPITPLKL